MATICAIVITTSMTVTATGATAIKTSGMIAMPISAVATLIATTVTVTGGITGMRRATTATSIGTITGSREMIMATGGAMISGYTAGSRPPRTGTGTTGNNSIAGA